MLYFPSMSSISLWWYQRLIRLTLTLSENDLISQKLHPSLTLWCLVTHMWVRKLIIIGSGNGLSPVRPQATSWTNSDLVSIEPLGSNFGEIRNTNLQSWKCIWKSRMQNGRHFVQVGGWVNSLWPSDAIWHRRSTLVHVMNCAIIRKDDSSPIRSCGIYLCSVAQEILKMYIIDMRWTLIRKITSSLPRTWWVDIRVICQSAHQNLVRNNENNCRFTVNFYHK